MTRTGFRLKTINRSQAAALAWLDRHYDAGFQPEWFLTVHFHFPSDPQSRRKTDASRRTDLDRAFEYARFVSNALQRVLWSNREGTRLDRQRNPIPTLFAVERDAQQHHLHIMIPRPLNVPNTQAAIERAWRVKMIRACKSLSKHPIGFDVRDIWDREGLSHYFVKQTTDRFPSIDYVASTLPPLPRISASECRAGALRHSSSAHLRQSSVPWPPPSFHPCKAGRSGLPDSH